MQGSVVRRAVTAWIAFGSLLAFIPAAASAAGCADKTPPAGFVKVSSSCVPEGSACKDSSGQNAYDVGEKLDCPAGQACCLLMTTKQAAESGAAPAAGGGPRLELPGCIKSGKCGLDDIVMTGTAFANLITELSAAAFFATFIYGGAMYLLSFGRSDWVSKGTKAMTGAMIGMGIVLAAWTIVNYIASSLLGAI